MRTVAISHALEPDRAKPRAEMRISSSDTIAGLPALVARDFARNLREADLWGWSPAVVGEVLSLSEAEALELLTQLEAAGLVERSPQVPENWITTLQGNALANASAARPVSRKTATRNLEALINRARAINADPGYLYWVTKLVLFGSYLDPAVDPVGDVDIAVELRPRETDRERFEQRAEERRQLANRAFSNIVEHVCWPEIEVRRTLKGGSRVISMTTTEDRILERTQHETVYEFPEP